MKSGTEMAKLHLRGVELLVDLLDAAEQVENLSHEAVRELLRETASVLGELLKRDVPPNRQDL